MADSPEEVCLPHFPWLVKGTEQWFRVGPGLRKVEPQRQDRSPKGEEKHTDDEIGV